MAKYEYRKDMKETAPSTADVTLLGDEVEPGYHARVSHAAVADKTTASKDLEIGVRNLLTGVDSPKRFGGSGTNKEDLHLSGEDIVVPSHHAIYAKVFSPAASDVLVFSYEGEMINEREA
jgi:hypothetical protein